VTGTSSIRSNGTNGSSNDPTSRFRGNDQKKHAFSIHSKGSSLGPPKSVSVNELLSRSSSLGGERGDTGSSVLSTVGGGAGGASNTFHPSQMNALAQSGLLNEEKEREMERERNQQQQLRLQQHQQQQRHPQHFFPSSSFSHDERPDHLYQQPFDLDAELKKEQEEAGYSPSYNFENHYISAKTNSTTTREGDYEKRGLPPLPPAPSSPGLPTRLEKEYFPNSTYSNLQDYYSSPSSDNGRDDNEREKAENLLYLASSAIPLTTEALQQLTPPKELIDPDVALFEGTLSYDENESQHQPYHHQQQQKHQSRGKTDKTRLSGGNETEKILAMKPTEVKRYTSTETVDSDYDEAQQQLLLQHQQQQQQEQHRQQSPSNGNGVAIPLPLTLDDINEVNNISHHHQHSSSAHHHHHHVPSSRHSPHLIDGNDEDEDNIHQHSSRKGGEKGEKEVKFFADNHHYDHKRVSSSSDIPPVPPALHSPHPYKGKHIADRKSLSPSSSSSRPLAVNHSSDPQEMDRLEALYQKVTKQSKKQEIGSSASSALHPLAAAHSSLMSASEEAKERAELEEIKKIRKLKSRSSSSSSIGSRSSSRNRSHSPNLEHKKAIVLPITETMKGAEDRYVNRMSLLRSQSPLLEGGEEDDRKSISSASSLLRPTEASSLKMRVQQQQQQQQSKEEKRRNSSGRNQTEMITELQRKEEKLLRHGRKREKAVSSSRERAVSEEQKLQQEKDDQRYRSGSEKQRQRNQLEEVEFIGKQLEEENENQRRIAREKEKRGLLSTTLSPIPKVKEEEPYDEDEEVQEQRHHRHYHHQQQQQQRHHRYAINTIEGEEKDNLIYLNSPPQTRPRPGTVTSGMTSPSSSGGDMLTKIVSPQRLSHHSSGDRQDRRSVSPNRGSAH
jgi:hypothetical protein